MIVSGAAKPSSKVLSLVCFSISFFNYSTKKRGAAWQMYWLCQEGMIWIWIVHKIVQLLRPHLCVNKIFASNEYWLWSRSQMMGVYCNAIFILFSRIWSHSVCLNIVNKKNKKKSAQHRNIYDSEHKQRANNEAQWSGPDKVDHTLQFVWLQKHTI